MYTLKRSQTPPLINEEERFSDIHEPDPDDFTDKQQYIYTKGSYLQEVYHRRITPFANSTDELLVPLIYDTQGRQISQWGYIMDGDKRIDSITNRYDTHYRYFHYRDLPDYNFLDRALHRMLYASFFTAGLVGDPNASYEANIEIYERLTNTRARSTVNTPGAPWQVDHIKPAPRNSSVEYHHLSNLQLVMQIFNLGKKNINIGWFLLYLRKTNQYFRFKSETYLDEYIRMINRQKPAKVFDIDKPIDIDNYIKDTHQDELFIFRGSPDHPFSPHLGNSDHLQIRTFLFDTFKKSRFESDVQDITFPLEWEPKQGRVHYQQKHKGLNPPEKKRTKTQSSSTQKKRTFKIWYKGHFILFDFDTGESFGYNKKLYRFIRKESTPDIVIIYDVKDKAKLELSVELIAKEEIERYISFFISQQIF